MKNIFFLIYSIILISGCQNSNNDSAIPQPDGLKIISWGGQYQDSQQIAIFDSYQDQHPAQVIKVIDKAGGALNKLRNRRYTRASQWDVIDMIGADAVKACNEGLLVKLNDKDLIPKSDLLDHISAIKGFECAIPNVAFSTAFAYRSNAWGGRKPKTIKDFFNLKQFPGKRSLQKTAENNLIWALLADGVAIDQVYELLKTEEGLNQAFRKLNTIKKHTLWWEEGKLPTNWLASEKVVFASAYNARIFQAITTNKDPIEFFWDWQALDLDVWVIPQTSIGQIKAKEFIEHAVTTRVLADQARYLPYGPIRKSAAEKIGQNPDTGIEMGKYSPTSPQNLGRYFIVNYTFWEQHAERLQERFDQWLEE